MAILTLKTGKDEFLNPLTPDEVYEEDISLLEEEEDDYDEEIAPTSTGQKSTIEALKDDQKKYYDTAVSLMEKLNKAAEKSAKKGKKEKKPASVEETQSEVSPYRSWSSKYDTLVWGTDRLDTYVKIEKEEYEALKANQKPKEWSDDVVLIDINKLTAYLISEYSGVDMEGDELYSRHKQNAFSDEQFEMWDKMYQTILKFRSNEL